jgi:CIC family chloride channel protein
VRRRAGPRVRFLLALLIVSSGAALFAVAFRSLLALIYARVYHASNVVEAMTTLSPWLRIAVPMAGGALAGLISRMRPSQNVSNVMEAVVLGNVQLSLRTTLFRITSSGLAIASGMSIGREGPLIEFGGSLGAALGRRLRTTLAQTRVLVASGTAAGFAAAYNTPFAAILFVFETILGIAAPAALLPTMAATVIGTGVTRAVVGSGPIYGQRSFPSQSASDLVLFAVLGVLAAAAASGFKRVLRLFESAFERRPLPQPLRSTVGGLVVGLLILWMPDVAGNGYEPLNVILDQRMMLTTVSLLLVGKVLATSASVGSGVPGGIFTPMLLLGAALGTLMAHAVTVAFSLPTIPGSFALVGMAATTAASIHAPITAAVLVFELSGDYGIVLPLLLSTTIATVVSRLLGSESIYDTELRQRGLSWQLTLEGRRVTRADERSPHAVGPRATD